MDRQEIYNTIKALIEQDLTSVPNNNWALIKNSLIGKELISIVATDISTISDMTSNGVRAFDYKLAPASALVDLANFMQIPLVWVRPTYINCIVGESSQALVVANIQNSQFVGMMSYKGAVCKLNKFKYVEKPKMSTILVDDRPRTGYKLTNPILECLQIKSSEGFKGLSIPVIIDAAKNYALPTINLKDKTVFVLSDKELDITNYVADEDIVEISEDTFKNASVPGLVFNGVVQGESSIEVARNCISKWLNRTRSLASEQAIVDFVNAESTVVDCIVTAMNNKVTVYVKPAKGWTYGYEDVNAELDSYGILGYSYKIREANEVTVSLVINGEFSTDEKLQVQSLLQDKYKYETTSYNWVPSLLEIKSLLVEALKRYDFDITYVVSDSSTSGVKYKPVENTVKVKLASGVYGGYDEGGIIYKPDEVDQVAWATSGSIFGYWCETCLEGEPQALMLRYEQGYPSVCFMQSIEDTFPVILRSSYMHAYSYGGVCMVVVGSTIYLYDINQFTDKNIKQGRQYFMSINADDSFIGVRKDQEKEYYYRALNPVSKQTSSRPLCYIGNYLYCDEVGKSSAHTITRYSQSGEKEVIAQVGDIGLCRGCHYDGKDLFIIYNDYKTKTNKSVVLFNLNEVDQYLDVYNLLTGIGNDESIDVVMYLEPNKNDMHLVCCKDNIMSIAKITNFAVQGNVVRVVGSKLLTSVSNTGTYNITFAPVKGGIVFCVYGQAGNAVKVVSDSGAATEVKTFKAYLDIGTSIGTVNYETGDINLTTEAELRFKSTSIVKDDKTFVTLNTSPSYEQ